MKALDKIKTIEQCADPFSMCCYDEKQWLVKAFKTMRAVAICLNRINEYGNLKDDSFNAGEVDDEFEKAMK